MNLHAILIWFLGALVVLPSLIWWLGIVRWRIKKTASASAECLPFVSVIVAGKNEEDYIGDCLKSIVKSDYPSDSLELVFVDDHSADKTLQIAEATVADSIIKAVILSAPDEPRHMGSKKRALAHAVAHAQGEILLFTDADNRVPSGWLRAMAVCFHAETGAVLGAAIPQSGGSLGAFLYRLERIMVALTSAAPIGWGLPGSACGQNLSLRKSAFEEIGGHAHSVIPSGDDDLTVQAMARSGWKVAFAGSPHSVVFDARQPSLRSHRHATTRHQSVTRFYPVQWRLLYAFSILSGLLLTAWLCFGISVGNLSATFWYILGTKLLIDSSTLIIFTKRLAVRISIGDLIAAHILLPVYQIVRPLFSLRTGYRWRSETPLRSDGALSK